MNMTIIRIIGVSFSLLYATNTCLGAIIGTCTMGDDGHFISSVIYGIPFFLISFGCLWYTRKLQSNIYILLLTAISGIIILLVWIPLVYYTTILGNHLCGENYNEYIGESYFIERLVPFTHFILAISLIAFSIITFAKRLKN